MSRHLLLAAVWLTCGGFAQAQTAGTPLERFLATQHAGVDFPAGAKGTAARPRLIHAFNGFSASGVIQPYDSLHMVYSQGRGGDNQSAVLPFDTQAHYMWDPAGGGYRLYSVASNTFDGAGRVDTATTNNAPGTTANLGRKVYTYNSAGQKATQTAQTFSAGSWVNYTMDSFSYTAAGDLAVQLSCEWGLSGVVWKPLSRATYSYDAAGKVTQRLMETYSSGAWGNAGLYAYVYDAAGNLTSWTIGALPPPAGAGDIRERHRYYYDVANLRISQTYESLNLFGGPGGMKLVMQDSTVFGTAGASPVLKTYTHYYPDSSGWVLSYRNTITLNAAGNLQLLLKETRSGNAWVNSNRTFYFYNSYDQEVREYTETWLGNATWGIAQNNDREARLYYENYAPAGVTGGPGHGPLLVVGPVPAGNGLTVAVSLEEAQPFSAFIIDAAGRIVQSWSSAGAAGLFYTREIDTRNMPAGVYLLRVRSSGGDAGKVFTVQH